MPNQRYEERSAIVAHALHEMAAGSTQTSAKLTAQIGCGVILALLAIARAIENASTK